MFNYLPFHKSALLLLALRETGNKQSVYAIGIKGTKMGFSSHKLSFVLSTEITETFCR